MNKKILRLAIPNILSNLSVPLLSSVDTAIVGHLEKVSYLGAIAIGSMIFNFVYWGFGFLRMGTTGLTAQAFGKKNDEEIILVLARSLSVAFAAAILIFGLQYFIKEISFYLVTTGPEVEKYARDYFDIRIFAAPATLGLYAFHGWFLGMQNAKYPLILTVVVNVLNIGFNFLFIYGYGMNVDGVALGTVFAQYLGLILSIFLYLKKYREFTAALIIKKITDVEPIKKFFSVNFDIFLRTLSLIFAFTFFTAVSADLGTEILAANTILLQLWMILSYGVDGFAFAAESLVGKYIGAGNKQKLQSAIKYSFIWGIGLGVILTIIYFFLDREILAFYTDKTEIINLASAYFIWTLLAPLTNSICYIWDGVFIGATATKPMRNSMLLSVLIFYLPIYYLTVDILGNDALWLAMISFMIVRGVSLTLYAPKYILSRTFK
ncbi:MAG: MATE family efflux transporter [Ignavibacteriales bacterium]|jgi:MATE family multidrug resistance protein|nr:MAG: MATE family efflux transporter [Ignavibacteriales bacterium]